MTAARAGARAGRGRAPRAGSDDPPPHTLRQYSLIADGIRGGLIGPMGDLVWMCLPDWSGEGVFSGLIGGRGYYLVRPAGPCVWGGFYESGLIWRGRWVTRNGLVESREAMARPADRDRAVVLRRVSAERGEAVVEVRLRPCAGFGYHGLTDIKESDGVWTARSGSVRIRFQAPPGVRVAGARGDRFLTLDMRIEAGQTADLVLEMGESLPDRPVVAAEAWSATETQWADVPSFFPTLDPGDVARSRAVICGLTGPGGGAVAAATTSLPERAEAGRDYDYRYVWIRDQCYIGQAAAAIGDDELLSGSVRFVTERLLADGSSMAPAYTPDGGRVPDQFSLGLPGYPGGFDCIGNWVNQQFQLDAFGEALLLLAAADRRYGIDAETWRSAEVAADTIAHRWFEPDAGIWELEPQSWTHSRLTAVAGLRAMAARAPAGAQRPDWLALADRIVADTTATHLHRDGYWMRSDTDAGLDGALLMPPLRGALPADDPRTVITLDRYLQELAPGGYAYRFRHDPRPLGHAEGSFTLCGFLAAMALHQQGRDLAAARWYERIKAACGPPMLYAEEYDAAERQMRGNLPQAFVHAMFMEASARLAAPPG